MYMYNVMYMHVVHAGLTQFDRLRLRVAQGHPDVKRVSCTIQINILYIILDRDVTLGGDRVN